MNHELQPVQASTAEAPSAPSKGRPRRSAGLKVDLTQSAPRQILPLTLLELCQLYDVEDPSRRNFEMHIRKWLEDFGLGAREAWGIKTEELEAGVEHMLAHGYARATANRDISHIGTLYRYAQEKKLCPPGFVSPTLAVVRKTEKPRYVPPAKPGEWTAMRQAARTFADPHFQLFVWLLMDTGARRSEITERRWDEFKLDAPEGPHVELLFTKTNVKRRIYFSHETAALLRRLRPAERYRGELAFKGRNGAPRKFQEVWSRYCERIGRPDLHVHDLRHMVAAELLKDGKGASQVASLLGHSIAVLHNRYGHLDDAGIRSIQAERLGLQEDPNEVWSPVAEAKRRHAEREQQQSAESASEAQRLALLAQDAADAAAKAAQALAAAQAAMQAARSVSPSLGAMIR